MNIQKSEKLKKWGAQNKLDLIRNWYRV